ncbi:adenosine receptor A3-like isoform X2 [Thunnus albacares]|uniref:adenosine receptor A3-like isoform X2 n=1 Tax=Thunnus albacares TaxID=8236 RepID=UPI001CF67747|nr:adenosine receptor A3-like isoform X2 [Thunnus albacares]
MISSPGIKPREHVDMMYISIETAIALASVLGNVLVVLVVCVNRALRNTTFCFIVSLAVADIAVGVLVIPLAIIISLGFNTQFYTCLFLSCLLLIITQGSILSLLAIAIDRYLRVKIPTRYCTIVTQRRAYVAVCLCWILSFLTGLVPMIGWNNRDAQQNLSSSSDIICKFTTVMRMDYMVYFNFFGLLCYLIPLLIMAVLCGYIFWTIRGNLREKPGNSVQTQSSNYLRKEKQLAGSLSLVLVLFALSWLPLHIMNCIAYFGGPNIVAALYVGILLSHANSAVNPVVYAFKIQKIKTAYLKIWRRCIECGEENRGSQTSQTTDINLSININSVAKYE